LLKQEHSIFTTQSTDMKKIGILTGLLVSCLIGRSQLVIQQGAGLVTTGDVHLILESTDLVNNDMGTSFLAAIVTCKGDGSNVLAGNGYWRVKQLVVDKAGGKLSLNTDIEIVRKLQMVSGPFDLSGKNVYLLQGAGLEGESDTGRVVGPSGGAIQASVHMSAPVSYNAGNLGAAITSNSNLGMVTVRRMHNIPPGESRVQRYFQIIPEYNNGLDATVRLVYLDAELGGLSESTLNIHTRSTDAAPWTPIGSSARNSTQNYIEKTGLASLEQFSIAGAVSIPLPLKWGAVQVACTDAKANISWTTLQEQGVKEFVVESSRNGTGWTPVATIAAAGTSTVPRTYTYRHTASGVMLYRIRSIDLDGAQHFSAVVRFSGCTTPLTVSAYPVPARDKTTLQITTPVAFSGTVNIVGVDGKQYGQVAVEAAAGDNAISIPLQKLAAGTYYLVLQTPEGLRTVKMAKE
jgi:hypothetical protein